MEEIKNNQTRLERYRGKSAEEVFNEVYDINDWSSEESKSGVGSTLEFTKNARKILPGLFKRHGIERILDVACGDFNWMKKVANSKEVKYYKGIDIVQRIIDSNNKRYKKENKIEFEYGDITKNFDNKEKFDAIIAKDVLVHFPDEFVIKAIEDFKKSGVKYLILTHFYQIRENRNIGVFGQWRPINFTIPPFNFENPIEMIRETETYKYGENKIIMRDKTLSLWKIND